MPWFPSPLVTYWPSTTGTQPIRRLLLVSYKPYQPLILPFVFLIFCNLRTVFNSFSAFWSRTPSQCFSTEYQSSACFPPYIVQSQEATCLAFPMLMLPIPMKKKKEKISVPTSHTRRVFPSALRHKIWLFTYCSRCSFILCLSARKKTTKNRLSWKNPSGVSVWFCINHFKIFISLCGLAAWLPGVLLGCLSP